VKVPLHGTPGEVDQATRRLLEVLDVVAVSQPDPDRGASVLVRVYLQVRLDPPGPATSLGRAARRPGRALP
jgi:acyl-coenzyme A synthetase/AMP-(fatty) acid ligase